MGLLLRWKAVKKENAVTLIAYFLCLAVMEKSKDNHRH